MKSLNEAVWKVIQSSLTRNGMSRTKSYKVEGKTPKEAWKNARHNHLMKHGLSHLPTLHLHSIKKVSEEKNYKSLAHTINEVVGGILVKGVVHAADVIPKHIKKIEHGAYISNRKHPGKKDDYKFIHPLEPQMFEEESLEEGNQKSALARSKHSIAAKRTRLNKSVRPTFKIKKNKKTGAISFIKEGNVDKTLKGKNIFYKTSDTIKMKDSSERYPVWVSPDYHKENPEFPTHLDNHTINQLKTYYGFSFFRRKKLDEVVRSDQRTEIPVTKYDPKDNRMEVTKRNRRRKEITLGKPRGGSYYAPAWEPYVNPVTGDVGPSY